LVFFRGSPPEVGEQLKNGDFEIAVAGPLDDIWDRFRSYTLFRTTFRLFMNRAHPLSNQQSVALSRLAGERLMMRPYCELAGVVSRSLAEHGVATTDADTVASDQDVLAMLEANLGISILPATTPCTDVVLSVPVEGLSVEWTAMLHTVIGRQHSPAAAGLIQLLRATNWSEVQRQLSAAAA
jgi:hypothetical protein